MCSYPCKYREGNIQSLKIEACDRGKRRIKEHQREKACDVKTLRSIVIPLKFLISVKISFILFLLSVSKTKILTNNLLYAGIIILIQKICQI